MEPSGATMRRFLLVLTALACLIITAAAAPTFAGGAGFPVVAAKKPITAGSVWTIYNSGKTSCSVVGFSDSFAFMDDRNGFGNWSGGGTLRWESDGYLADNAVYRGKYDRTTKRFVGPAKLGRTKLGIFTLAKGDDPLNEGGC